MRWVARHEQDLARSQAERAALANAARAAGVPLPPASVAPAPAPVAAPKVPELDFVPLTTGRPAAVGPSEEGNRAFREAAAAVAALEAWTKAQLLLYKRERALLVRDVRGALADRTIYSDASGRLTFAESGAQRPREWATLGVELQASIIVSALRNAEPRPSPEIVRGAEAFAYLHGLPEMASELLRRRRSDALFPR
jgi:hypothetical protein